MADQRIAIPMHAGPEFGLSAATAAATTVCCAAGQLPTWASALANQRSVEALLQQSTTGADVTATSGDVVLRPIAGRSGLVQQFFADQHFRNQFN